MDVIGEIKCFHKIIERGIAMKIISARTKVETKEYWHDFVSKGDESSGFMLDCTPTGELLNPQWHSELQKELMARCGKDGDLIYNGIHEWTNVFNEPAVGECEYCKKEVQLTGFTNQCDCGELYNVFGQHLVAREYWEETDGDDDLSLPECF